MSPNLSEKMQSPVESFEFKAPSTEQLQQQYNLIKLAAEKINSLPAETSEQEKVNIVLETIFGINPEDAFGKKQNALGHFAKKIGLGKKTNADLIQGEELPIKLDTLKQIDSYLKANKILNNIDAAADVPLFVGLGMVGLPLVAAVPVGVALSEGLYNYAFQPIQNRDIMEVKRRDQSPSKVNNVAHWAVRTLAIGATAVGASIAIPAMFSPQPMIMDAHLEQLKDGPKKLNKAVESKEKSVFERQNFEYKKDKTRLDSLVAARKEAKETYESLQKIPNPTKAQVTAMENAKGRYKNPTFNGEVEISRLTKKLDALDVKIPEIQEAKGFRKQSESVLSNFNNAIQLPQNRNVLETVVDDIGKWDAISNWTNLDKSIGFGDKLQLALKETEKNPFGFYLATGIAALISASGLIMGKALKNNGEFAMSRQIEYIDELSRNHRSIMELLKQFVQNELTIAYANNNPVEAMRLKATLAANGASVDDLNNFDSRAKASLTEAKSVESLLSGNPYNIALKIANSYRVGLVGGKLSEVDAAYIDQKDAEGSKENKELENGNKLQLELKAALRSAKAKNSTESIIEQLESSIHKFAGVKNEVVKLSPRFLVQQLKNLRKPKNPDTVEMYLDGMINITNIIKELNETKITEPVKLKVSKFLLECQIGNPDDEIRFGVIKSLVENANPGVLNQIELQDFVDNVEIRRYNPEEKIKTDKLAKSLLLFLQKNSNLHAENKLGGNKKGFNSKFFDEISKVLEALNKLDSVKNNSNTDPRIAQLRQNLNTIMQHTYPTLANPEEAKSLITKDLKETIKIYNS
jgi:hypothetical protein